MVNLPVPTWASNIPGNLLTSAMWNSNIYNNGTFLTNPPIVQITQSSAQALAHATLTAIGFDTTLFDTYGGHSNVTNNPRYTPTAPGLYLVLAAVSFASNTTGGRDVEIRKNAVTVNVGQGAGQGSAGAINTTIDAWAFIQCNGTTDYIDVVAYQSSGVSLNTVPSQTGMGCLFIHA
ncbi:hypothetical protein OG689_11055 [Kitasatospora sp. NBC_00240]|uniref:hypothetical protein n=1 Tax=Kitasatospora sp. NBC_00240 TaxID=2903567 RepID=UPI00224EE24B|nr:hypothetical protein [Kitasatospora sp. NBC_00240]MCX5209823.1 hypothetical protein [Kitasatospora sp. NBC_00240]